MERGAPFEAVTKLEAAERQLRVAIRLFFERRDPIAVHTLATAAQEILRRLAAPRGLKGMYEYADDLIRPEKKKELFGHFRKAQNFFKHAGKDPDEKLDFYYEGTKFDLFDAVLLCGPLTGRLLPEMAAFFGWFLSKYPSLFRLKDAPDLQGFMQAVKNVNFDDFDLVVDVIERFNRHGMPKVNTGST
jgi:hypothetical protein